MKTRITLTIDPRVSHRVKRLARERGTSVSGLVERLLAELIEERPCGKPEASFSERWRGKLRLARKSDIRFRRLAAKYNR